MSDLPTRDQYAYFLPIQTRWMDNDAYGHVNNVAYYSYFDTVANHYLIHRGGLDIENSPVIGVVAESQCTYRSPLAYPQLIEAGLRVDFLGNRSVQYGIAIFAPGANECAAYGRFVHVFVNRTSNKAVLVPPPLRTALEGILREL
ncbi:MAG: acyl-CoA thioesterase [Gammaproteobacteria bacterium]|jgi:acyl-CoA thioester hydrolase|nr:acyl-CoA thioesterase [Gammaproteobacteria bacterium]